MKTLLIVLLACVIWGSIACTTDAPAAASDARDQQIKALQQRLSQLENQPKEHHYELRVDGLRTFRFDPTTGDTCIQLTTNTDWKKPETVRQGCQYQDFLANSANEPGRGYMKAECWFVGVKSACQTLPQ